MKKLLLSLVLISALTNAQVTSFPWTETFETDSPTVGLWTEIFESGTQEWDVVQTAYTGYTTGPYQGSYMAEFDIASFDGDATKYVSPVLNLTGATSPTLEFYYRNKDWDGDQNELKVYYRTSSSTPWNLIATYNSSVTPWTSSGVLSLPSPSSTYQVALEGIAYYGRSVNVDNVKVSAGALSTSEVNQKKNLFKIYPNPVSDDVNITSSAKVSEITIFDLGGKKIKSLLTEKSEINISLQSLPTGTYIVQVKNTDGSKTSQKFIKK